MAAAYRRFYCLNPKCWYGKGDNRKARWKIYITKYNLRLECRSCGFVVRIPLSCSVCGAENKLQGELLGSTTVFNPGDIEYVQTTRIEEDDEE